MGTSNYRSSSIHSPLARIHFWSHVIVFVFISKDFFNINNNNYASVLAWECITANQQASNIISLSVLKPLLIEGDDLIIDCQLDRNLSKSLNNEKINLKPLLELNSSNIDLQYIYVGNQQGSPSIEHNHDMVTEAQDMPIDNEEDIGGFSKTILNNDTVRFTKYNVTSNDTGIYKCSLEVPTLYPKNPEYYWSCSMIYVQPKLECRFEKTKHLTCHWSKLENFNTYIQYKDGDSYYPCPIANSSSSQCVWKLTTQPKLPQWLQCSKDMKANVSLTLDVWSDHHGSHHDSGQYHITAFNFELPCSSIIELQQIANFRYANVTDSAAYFNWEQNVEEPSEELYDNEFILVSYKALVNIDNLVKTSDIDMFIGKDLLVEANVKSLGLITLRPNIDYRISIRRILMDEGEETILAKGPESTQTFKTKCAVPDRLPDIEHSAFEINYDPDNKKQEEYETLSIYWPFLDKVFRNGNKFGYGVIELYGDEKIYRPNIVCDETRENCSRLTVRRPNANVSHTFRIIPTNECGQARKYAKITVPPRDKLLAKPLFLSARMLTSWDKYNITWIDVKRASYSNKGYYTLFWCSDYHDQTHNCLSIEGSKNISGSERSHLLKLNHTSKIVRKFAISYNEGDQTSGIMWSDCALHSDSSSEFKSTVSVLNATTIKLEWKFECSSQQSALINYLFELSSRPLPLTSVCTTDTNQLNSRISSETYKISPLTHESIKRYALFNVRPFTQYNITMHVESTNEKREQQIKLLQITTPEYSPFDSPKNLSAGLTTDSSIHLTWMPPTFENGDKYYYQIDHEPFINMEDEDKTEQRVKLVMTTASNTSVCMQSVNLTNLEPYTDYNVSVRACIQSNSNKEMCSPKSNSIFVRTKPAKPKRMDRPQLTEVKTFSRRERRVNITWNPPKRFNGRKLSYILYSKLSNSLTDFTVKTVNHTINHMEINVDCTEQKEKLEYSIAAYNGIYFGDPSEPVIMTICEMYSQSEISTFSLLTFTALLILLVFAKSKHSHVKKKYRGINPCLPDALVYLQIDHNYTIKKETDKITELKSKDDSELLRLNDENDLENKGKHIERQISFDIPDYRNELMGENCFSPHDINEEQIPLKEEEDDISNDPKPIYVPFERINHEGSSTEYQPNEILRTRIQTDYEELYDDTRSIQSISSFLDNLIRRK